jgi:hypothetical protein
LRSKISRFVSRDFGFTNNVRQGKAPEKFKLLRVTLEQKTQDEFIKDFLAAFRAADLKNFQHGDDWP